MDTWCVCVGKLYRCNYDQGNTSRLVVTTPTPAASFSPFMTCEVMYVFRLDARKAENSVQISRDRIHRTLAVASGREFRSENALLPLMTFSIGFDF